jgi:hypothetical protein
MIESILILFAYAMGIMGTLFILINFVIPKNQTGNELEKYIIKNNPQNNCDIERLITEFYRKKKANI